MNKLHNNIANPCTDKLSDIEYLEHMIPHHQVAIDMSHLVQPSIESVTILNLSRDIIRKQSYEIFEMKGMKTYNGDVVSNNMWRKGDSMTSLDLYNPNLSKSACNPLFFKQNDH